MQSGFGFGAGVDPPLEPPELPEEPEPPDGLAALPDPEEDPPVLGLLEPELPAEGLDVLAELEVPEDGLPPELEELPVLGFGVLLELPVFLLAELLEAELEFVTEELLEEDSLLLSVFSVSLDSVSVSTSALFSVTLTLKELFALLPEESTAVIKTA